MQYGHCVTCATATAMSCLVLAGSAPSANTFWLNVWKASWTSGASRLRVSDRSREGRGEQRIQHDDRSPEGGAPIGPQPINVDRDATHYPTEVAGKPLACRRLMHPAQSPRTWCHPLHIEKRPCHGIGSSFQAAKSWH